MKSCNVVSMLVAPADIVNTNKNMSKQETPLLGMRGPDNRAKNGEGCNHSQFRKFRAHQFMAACIVFCAFVECVEERLGYLELFAVIVLKSLFLVGLSEKSPERPRTARMLAIAMRLQISASESAHSPVL